MTEAKRITARVVDIQYLLDIHENNVLVLYSDTLSKQVPKSYAANAFNIFREAMHQTEVVRICTLWDSATRDRVSISTVIELIDDQKVIDALADQARAGHPEEIGKRQAEHAVTSLREAIKNARAQREPAQLKAIRKLRDEHISDGMSRVIGAAFAVRTRHPTTPPSKKGGAFSRPIPSTRRSLAKASETILSGSSPRPTGV